MNQMLLRWLLLCGTPLAFSCHAAEHDKVHRDGEQMSHNLDALSAKLGVSLPGDARIIGVASEEGMDDMLRVKLEMPTPSLTRFLADSKVPHFDDSSADILGPDEGFWDPHKATRLRIGDIQLAGARFLTLAIDDSRQGIATVYVMNHGT
jgi:hypothetical protein